MSNHLPNLNESVLKDEQTMPLVVSSESEPGYGDAPCDSIGDSGIKESLDMFTRKKKRSTDQICHSYFITCNSICENQTCNVYQF